MLKMQRKSMPACLSNWEEWGREWQQRRLENTSAVFQWKTVDGVRVNQTIMPDLVEQSAGHCSFCDAYPVSPPSIDTIEHFKPKSEFPINAYQWSNLYYCCVFCQRKNGAYQSEIIAPDENDYAFDRYFMWSYTDGLIMVNPLASPHDKARAQLTIDYFRFNEGHPAQRKEALFRRSRMPDVSLDKFPYRGYINVNPNIV